ncbi:MAG: tetratricopeptide repeat protein [Cyanobacteria bacterium SZAS LIN-5]|nr:tetratricopeptide repeat protein [Cyanobacteria bacterium SZAS LIN-5]
MIRNSFGIKFRLLIAASVLLSQQLVALADETAKLNPPVKPGESVVANGSFAWREALLEGRKQQELKHLTVAQSCFEAALKEAKRVHASDADLIICYRALGEIFVQQDIAEDANQNYKRALRLLKKNTRENFALLAETYGNLADIAYFDGDYPRAKKLFADGLKVLADANQRSSYLYASLQLRYGKVLCKIDDLKGAAEAYYDVISKLMVQADLPNNVLLVDALADYTDLFRNNFDQSAVRESSVQRELLKDDPKMFGNGKGVAPSAFSAAVAARLADQAVASLQLKNKQQTSSSSASSNRLTSPEGSSVSVSVNADRDAGQNVGNGLPGSNVIHPDRPLNDLALDQQVSQQRIDFYERMVSVDIKSLGPNHPSVARDLISLATVYLAQNNFSEAKPLLQRALVIYESSYGAKSALTDRTRTLIGVISEEQRVRDAGQPPATEYVSKLPVVPVAAQTPEVALRLNYLALQCLSYGKTDQALVLYSWALATTARTAGERSMLAACCLNDYARVLRASSDSQTATQYENDAAAIVRSNIVRKATAKL